MKEITLTTDNFAEEVLRSDKPVFVDFWASWCGPCRMLAPAVARLAEEHPEIKVGKVNVDEEPELAGFYAVAAIPTMMLFVNGEPAKKTMGFMPYSELEAFIG